MTSFRNCITCGAGIVRKPGQRGTLAYRCDVCRGAFRLSQAKERREAKKRLPSFYNNVARPTAPAIVGCEICGLAFLRRPYGRTAVNCDVCLAETRARARVETEKRHERRRARARNQIRRAAGSFTPTQAATLRSHAKRCPLCSVKMVDDAGLPVSKEIDHIVPVNVGGSSDLWNLRVICRACNGSRPKDGSDVAQLTIAS